ncbi:MAG: L,D-transpeptidase family protein [Pseudomonadota bacterium]
MTPQDLLVGPWGAHFMGRRFPAAIGKSGMTNDKREGDGASPRGSHRIVGMLYRPDRIRRPADWAVPIGPRDLWSDDPADPNYNHRVKAPHAFRHERLRRPDPLYDLVLLTNWNWPDSQPGQGSAIFLHAWRKPRHPTEGCVAFNPTHLRWIAARIQRGTRIIIR